jgi:hypothetical protein
MVKVSVWRERGIFLLALQPDVDDSHDDDWQHGSYGEEVFKVSIKPSAVGGAAIASGALEFRLKILQKEQKD